MTKTKKLLALLMAAVMVLGLLPAVALAETVEKTDTLTNQNTTGGSYSTWTITDTSSGAQYSINSCANTGEYIQLKSGNNCSGIVTTATGGKAKKVAVVWNERNIYERTIDIYGKNTEYTEPSDLFSSNNQGTYIGSINSNTSTELTIDDGYEYIGIRSQNGALYLSSVSITWEQEGSGDDPQPETYTVTFNYNDNGQTANTTAETGTDGKLTALPEPTWTDHNFLGWFTAATGGDQISTGTVFTADTTVYAHWEEVTPVTGDTYTKVLDTPADWSGTYLIVYDKYIFDGTDDSDNKTTLNAAAGSSIIGNYADSEIVIEEMAGGYSLYSTSKGQYMSGRGSSSNGTNYGDTAVAATIEVNNGVVTITSNTNIFAYSAVSGQERFRFYKPSTVGTGAGSYKLVSLYKKDAEPTTYYTVSFNANGGSGEMDSVTKAENAVYTVPANGFTAPEGYRFTGWKVGNAGDLLVAETDTITITGDVELFAQWELIQTYVVSFDANGGTGSMANVTTTSPYTLPACGFTAPEGKEFEGWKINGDDETLLPVGAVIDLTDNITLIAQWKDLPATTPATLAAALPDSGKVVIFNPAYGKALDACGTNGYYNAGVDCTPVNFVINATDNILWDVTKVSDGVYKFSQDGHYLSMGASYGSTPYDETNQEWQVAAYGGGYSIMNTVRECYLEWYDSKNYFSGYATISNNGMFTFEFYVVGGEAPATYTVSFDANGGSGNMDDVTDVTGPYELPACTFSAPAGKAFAGWTVDGGDGTVYQPGNTYVITEDTTFLATWTGDTKTYQLVTNESQLAQGGVYIMVGVDDADSAHALSKKSGNNKYRELVDVTINNGQIVLANSEVATAAADAKVFELTLGGSAKEGWTFDDVFNGYLCATSSGSNDMGTQTTLDNNGRFVVAIGTDGMVRATAKGEYTRNQIRYNSSSTRFACYTTNSSMKYFYLYKLVDPAPDGYYLVGNFGGVEQWTVDPMKQFTPNPDNPDEMMLDTVLAVNDKLKVVKLENGNITAYYPDNAPDYEIGIVNAGNVTIYFRQDGQGGDGWHYGYIYIAPRNFFKTQNLILSGQIGVQFFVDLSGLEPEEKAAAKVSFEITGKGKDLIDKGPLALDENNHNANWYYGFACKVNAIQMADTITATLNIGDNAIATKEYSVQQYIQAFEENKAQFDDTTVTLVEALCSYGYHVQQFLAAINGWTLGTDYTAVYTSFNSTYGVDAIKTAALENYPMTVTVAGEDVFKNPSMSLVLDSETAIRIFLAHEDGSKLNAENVTISVMPDNEDVVWDAETQLVKTQKGNRVMVEIKGIKAAWLAETFTITATEGDNTQTINVSALSYVGRLLASEAYADNAAAQNAVCALYYYAMAAKAYNE